MERATRSREERGKKRGKVVLAFQEFCNRVRKNKFIEKGLGDTEELWGQKEVKFHFLLHCSWEGYGESKSFS